MEKTERTARTADRLREALQASGKTQAELARATGLDKGAISSYLSGRYEPKQRAVALLARALGVAEMWLWGYDVPTFRTEEQKKRDQISQLNDKLQDDANFRELVAALADLTPEQQASIRQLVVTFGPAG